MPELYVIERMVENISKMPMNLFLDKEFYKPMEMNRTAYLPLRQFKKGGNCSYSESGLFA